MVLSTGWEPDVPVADTLARAFVLDWAAFNERITPDADRLHRDDDLLVTDGASSNEFLNVALLLHPDAALDPAPRIERARGVLSQRDGGPFVVASAWPTADLSHLGFELMGHPPLMARTAGGTRPSAPEGLDIREIRTPEDLRVFEDVEARAWESSPFSYSDLVLDVPNWHMWLGWADDEPVATAAASLGEGITRVEWIATLGSARGRGFGEAMTWQATMLDPQRDAVLIASDLGRPVYERMGYRALTRFTLWKGQRDR